MVYELLNTPPGHSTPRNIGITRCVLVAFLASCVMLLATGCQPAPQVTDLLRATITSQVQTIEAQRAGKPPLLLQVTTEPQTTPSDLPLISSPSTSVPTDPLAGLVYRSEHGVWQIDETGKAQSILDESADLHIAPDHQHAIFQTSGGDTWLVDYNQQNKRQLTSVPLRLGKWLPGGEQLVVGMAPGENFWGYLAMLHTRSGTLQLLADAGAAETTLSPDGQNIAFSAIVDEVGRLPYLYRLGETPALLKLSDYSVQEPYAGSPAWSPDGNSLTWITGNGNQQSGFSMAYTIFQRASLTAHRAPPFHLEYLLEDAWPPASGWSSDSRWLVYPLRQAARPILVIWNVASNAQVTIEDCWDYTWNPQSNWLACWSTGRSEIVLVEPDINQLIRLPLESNTEYPAQYSAAWNPAGLFFVFNPGNEQVWMITLPAEGTFTPHLELLAFQANRILDWLLPPEIPAFDNTWKPQAIPPTPETVCPLAPPARLTLQTLARVTLDGSNLIVRSTPQAGAENVIARLPQGTLMQITGGPVCALRPRMTEAYLYWQVTIPSLQLTGWVAEGDSKQYYVEAIK